MSDEDESEPLLLMLGKDGKLGLAPKMVNITEKDFKILRKGMKLLKRKYPKIAKECFE